MLKTIPRKQSPRKPYLKLNPKKNMRIIRKKPTNKNQSKIVSSDYLANETESHKSDDDIDDERTRREWLSEMVREEVEDRRPVNFKKPIKKARQMFPFRCSEYPAKCKTKVGFEAHLRNKHGM